jgi:single-strand DNA-binding protein
MSNLNLVALQGNLVRDAELVGKESNVARFSLAVNSGFGDNATVSFIDCVAFGKTAEIIGKHFTKGKQVIVRGQLHQNSWEDQEGNKRSRLEVRLDSFNGFNFVSGGAGSQEASAAAENEAEPAAAAQGGDGEDKTLF